MGRCADEGPCRWHSGRHIEFATALSGSLESDGSGGIVLITWS